MSKVSGSRRRGTKPAPRNEAATDRRRSAPPAADVNREELLAQQRAELPQRPTNLSALLAVSNALDELLQDYQTATMAVSGFAKDCSYDPEYVACTLNRLNDRLQHTTALLDASRGGQTIGLDGHGGAS